MNEELQRAIEELETSREELQSINEELEAMNAELNDNNELLRQANSDIKNLFESSDVATLFLDSQLCVRRFTPKTSDLFGVDEARDTGRPVSDLAQKFAHPDIIRDLEKVRKSLTVLEKEVHVEKTHKTYVLRVGPYRTVDDRIDGFVLTFFDVTKLKNNENQLKKNEVALRRQYSELETLYDTTPVGLALLRPIGKRDITWDRINDELAAINGFSVEEHIGAKQSELIPDVHSQVIDIQLGLLKSGEPSLGHEVRGTTPKEPDRLRDWIVDYYPVRNNDEIFALGVCVREVTAQKNLERDLADRELRLRQALETSRLGVFEVDVATGKAVTSARHDEVFGFDEPQDDWTVEKALSMHHPDDRPIMEEAINKLIGGETTIDLEVRICTPEDELRWGKVNLERIPDRIIGTIEDITDRKDSETRQNLLMAELQHRVKNTLASILAIVRFTARNSASIEEMSESLTRRLESISNTHNILTDANWSSIGLEEILKNEISPYSEGSKLRFDLDGGNLLLAPRDALAIAMAVHELVTNSAKYGALSSHNGSIEIGVSTNPETREHVIVWKEKNGPKVKAAGTKTGFGSFLLEKALAQQIEGTTKLSFEPDGLLYEISFTPAGTSDDPGLQSHEK